MLFSPKGWACTRVRLGIMLKGHGELRMANQKTLAYDGVMARIAQVKNGFGCNYSELPDPRNFPKGVSFH